MKKKKKSFRFARFSPSSSFHFFSAQSKKYKVIQQFEKFIVFFSEFDGTCREMGHQGRAERGKRRRGGKQERGKRERERRSGRGSGGGRRRRRCRRETKEKKTSNCNFEQRLSLSRALSLLFRPLFDARNPTAPTHQNAAPPLGLPELQASVLPRRGEDAPIGRRRGGDDGRGAPVDESGAVEGDHSTAGVCVGGSMLVVIESSSRMSRMGRRGSSSSSGGGSSSASSSSRHLNFVETSAAGSRMKKNQSFRFSLASVSVANELGLEC